MRPSTHDQPFSADDARGGPRVPLPRTPPTPENIPQVDGYGETDLDPIAQARVREAAARNASAARMFDEGRYDDAAPLFEQALASCRSLLGGDHPDTLTVAGNVAVAHLAAGNRRKGMKLISTNVAARARVFGDDHPITLVARNALAAAHRLAGDADVAVDMAKRVVVARTRTLGSAHEDTLSSRMELALGLAAAGDVNSAHRILAATVNDAEESLGPTHPHTEALVQCGLSHGLIHDEA